MKPRARVGIRELKNEASRIINEVCEREAEYIVTKRGEPVAVLRAVRQSDVGDDRSAQVARALENLRRTAKEIGRLSSGESAASVVSRQRR